MEHFLPLRVLVVLVLTVCNTHARAGTGARRYIPSEIGEEWTCPTDAWRCDNKRCVNPNHHCDGRNDCGDNSDERNCDPNKFTFSNEKRELRVKSAQKNTDIACFQCYVANSVGEEFSDGCLNVILPITISTRPPTEQTIEKGDIVNLTVVATSDKLYPVAYKWHFKNTNYEGVSAPPHVIYDVNTNLAYITTSDLTDKQMRDIRGVYRRQVYHEFETVFVDVDVKLKVQDELPTQPVVPITISTRPPTEQTTEKENDNSPENDGPNVVVFAVLGAVGGILILLIVLMALLHKMKVYSDKTAGFQSANKMVFHSAWQGAPGDKEDRVTLVGDDDHIYSESPDSDHKGDSDNAWDAAAKDGKENANPYEIPGHEESHTYPELPKATEGTPAV